MVHPSQVTTYTSSEEPIAVHPTPLSQLVGRGGGRGGTTRLKLYLTLLWAAKKEPFEVERIPVPSYAYLIGLPDPLGDGGRTIRRNLQWLTEHGFLREGPTGNHLILEETLRGVDYSPPFAARAQAKGELQEQAFHYYFKLSPRFWTKGLIVDLNAVEISCLLILLADMHRNRSDSAWWDEDTWKKLYGLSDDTRQRGFKGLEEKGVVAGVSQSFPSLDNPYARHIHYRVADVDLKT